MLENVEDEVRLGTREPCLICGSNDYYAEAGHYFCCVCNSQSQSAQVYVDEDFLAERAHGARLAVIRDKPTKEQETVKKQVQLLSTWEFWNVALRRMADRLVEIGFPAIIRNKFLHLYAAYMIRRKVIFVSKVNPEAKSAITLDEPITNLWSLYGIKGRMKTEAVRKRKFTFKRKLKDDGLAGPSDKSRNNADNLMSIAQKKRKVALTKRKAMENEYKITELAKQAMDDAEFERNLNAPMAVPKTANVESKEQDPKQFQIRLTKAARTLKKKYFKGLSVKKAIHKLRLPDARKKSRRLAKYKNIFAKILRYEKFTLKTCLVLVFVSLRQLGFPVVISDIWRLYRCGVLAPRNLPVLDTLKNFYDPKGFQGLDQVLMFYNELSLDGLAEAIQIFVEYMGIKRFFAPTMKEIVPKYIDDFVLPREFECLINLLNHAHNYDDLFKNVFRKGAGNQHMRFAPEVFVISQIFVLLKMLFGLDDLTERYISEFARVTNKVINEEAKEHHVPMENWTELFVIEDWFGYLRRRDELVKREMYSHCMFTPNRPPTTSQLNDLLLQSESSEITSITDDFKSLINEKYPNLPRETPRVKPYVPLPLPNQSIVKQFLAQYPNVHDPSFKPELFKMDFVQKRIDFLWKPKKYVELLECCGHKVKVIRGNARDDFPEQVEKDTILLFQPYKSFEDFVDTYRKSCPSSLKLLLGLCEDLIPTTKLIRTSNKGYSDEITTFLPEIIQNMGEVYVDKILRGRLTFLTQWDD